MAHLVAAIDMGAFIAGFTMKRGKLLAAGFHGLMELSLIGSARAPMEPYGNPHRPPSHISKTVLSTVHFGPPDLTKSRTFALRFRLEV